MFAALTTARRVSHGVWLQARETRTAATASLIPAIPCARVRSQSERASATRDRTHARAPLMLPLRVDAVMRAPRRCVTRAVHARMGPMIVYAWLASRSADMDVDGMGAGVLNEHVCICVLGKSLNDLSIILRALRMQSVHACVCVCGM